MKIDDPYQVESGSFLKPDEMQTVRGKYNQQIRTMAGQVHKCITCYLFNKCVEVSKLNEGK